MTSTEASAAAAAKPSRRSIVLSEVNGHRLLELATGQKLSVAECFDREFGDLLEAKWRAMLKAKLREADPALANSQADGEGR